MSQDPLSGQVNREPLEVEIRAFERIKQRLEARHCGEWAVVSGGDFWRVFDTFHAAAAAEAEFGDATFLIRQVGAKPQRMPSSLLFERPYVP